MIKNYRYKTISYYGLTFAVTYIFWAAGAYVSFIKDNNGLHMLLMLPGLIAPFVISLILILKSGNPELKKDFFQRIFTWKIIRLKMIPVFLFLMPASVLISTGISILLGESVSQFKPAEGFSFSTGFVPVLLLLLMAASFEELGWRGYAFDSLQSRYSFLKASVIFSVLWSLWHFPLVFVNNSYQYEIVQMSIWYGVNFFLSIIPMGIIISWICVKNRKSVVAAILFHFIINISQEVLAITQITKCIQTFVLTGVVLILIAADRDLFFSGERAKIKNKN